MVKGIGTDIIEVSRIEKAISSYGDRFLDKIFTVTEQEYCNKHKDSSRHFAGRFAAKEAIVKALGKGIGREIHWCDIEILNDEKGKPFIVFTPRVKDLLDDPDVIISISHCKEYATATAIWK
jgi:holo-[acyl-carrier protein] synthase